MSKRTNAGQMVEALLKTVHDDGDVNAARIWRGYEVSTGKTGWHVQWFGTSGAEFLGGSVSEVEEYVDAVASLHECN